jgi:pimeloyl-ACP methyl ester carboxylesterase
MGRVDVNGVGIEYEVTGQGRPVVLLHGFPDSGRLWRHQVPTLAGAGFQVIVPDLRGYGSTGKPSDVEAYSFVYLAGDVLAILDQLGVERAHLVGHDWGAALAWVMGSLVPDRIDHLVALSVGHPISFRAAGFPQLEKSWYLMFFQFEGIAERWLSDNSWANLRDWTKHPDIDAVIADLEANESLTPALSWYRANFAPSALVDPPMEFPPIQAPTMGVWSSGDFALTEEQMTGSSGHVSGPWRYERLAGPGHWLQLEAPDQVNRLLIDFLPV